MEAESNTNEVNEVKYYPIEILLSQKSNLNQKTNPKQSKFAVNDGQIREIQRQKINPVENLKILIQQHTKELIKTLESSEFQQTAFQKGWLNPKDKEQGQLIRFLKKIDSSKKYILAECKFGLIKFSAETRAFKNFLLNMKKIARVKI